MLSPCPKDCERARAPASEFITLPTRPADQRQRVLHLLLRGTILCFAVGCRIGYTNAEFCLKVISGIPCNAEESDTGS